MKFGRPPIGLSLRASDSFNNMSAPNATVKAAKKRAEVAEERAKVAEQALAASRAREVAAVSLAAFNAAALAERVDHLAPYAAAANESNKAIDAIMLCARFSRSKYCVELRAIGGLCRATRAEEQLWESLALVQHGKRKRTVLMYAAKKGLTERALWLLARGAPLEARDAGGRSALFIASQYNYFTTMCALIAAGADVNTTDLNGATPLIACCGNGNFMMMHMLLDSSALVNASTKGGFTALYYASKNGYIVLVKALLLASANANTRTKNGITALHIASINGHANIVRVLVNGGADINAVDDAGDTPLHEACYNDTFFVVVALVSAGVDRTVRNVAGKTARDLATPHYAVRTFLDLADNPDMSTPAQSDDWGDV